MAIRLSRLLIIVGTALLLWTAAVAVEAVWSQQQAHEALAVMLSQPASIDLRAGTPPALLLPLAPPSRGEPVGELSIPRVGLSAVVLHGADSRTLARGPGHVETTALPGEPGNVVIAGHRDTFFRSLQFVKRGDDVFLDSPRGRRRYRVDSLTIVSPRDVRVLAPTRTDTLTLITCYPFWVWGSAPDRYIVRATRVGR